LKLIRYSLTVVDTHHQREKFQPSLFSRNGGKFMRLRRNALLAFTSVLLLAGVAQGQMKVHFINVGQADSILLEFKTAAILIDAGGENTGEPGTTVGDRDLNRLIGYLNRFFDRRTDLNRTLTSIIISHPHIDHTRLIMDVIRNFRVRSLIDGGGRTGSGIEPLRQARARARTRNRARRIQYIMVADSAIGPNGFTPSILSKLRSSLASNVDIKFLSGGSRNCEDQNNNSLTVRVEHQGKKFLFTGDSEEDDPVCVGGQIGNLIERFDSAETHNGLLDVDVYKVGHHASFNGTTENLMLAMSPAISVISAGDRDTRSPERFHAFFFGHPREAAVKLLEEFTTADRQPQVTVYTMRGVRRFKENRVISKAIYCTCWDKNIVVEVGADGSMRDVMVNQP
jgi:competence protein ComEC